MPASESAKPALPSAGVVAGQNDRRAEPFCLREPVEFPEPVDLPERVDLPEPVGTGEHVELPAPDVV